MLRWISRLVRRPDRHRVVPVSEGQKEASSALQRAEEARAEVKAQSSEVKNRSESLRQVRVHNHFADLWKPMLGGER
ncbi:DUF7620 family protein [Streptomyces sp. 8L]|uniref:DUF7620 family protein n=1 Tax=Streptomyces sp. 8L TaxID=2877242 RepID=UPI003F8FF20D